MKKSKTRAEMLGEYKMSRPWLSVAIWGKYLLVRGQSIFTKRFNKFVQLQDLRISESTDKYSDTFGGPDGRRYHHIATFACEDGSLIDQERVIPEDMTKEWLTDQGFLGENIQLAEEIERVTGYGKLSTAETSA